MEGMYELERKVRNQKMLQTVVDYPIYKNINK